MNSSNFKIKLLNKAKRILSFFLFKKESNFSGGKFDSIDKQAELDKKLVYSFSSSKIPNLKQLKYIKKLLNAREAWLLIISLFILIVSIIFLGARFYFNHLQAVPKAGGEYVEGLIGSPKYINPLYAGFSDVDRDIGSLIFSSLLKRSNDGQLTKDLAVEYSVSEDHKTYTFKIRDDIKWHNGAPLSVDDIVFTFNTIKDSRYKSPLREGFIGVEINKIDESTVQFVLAESYAAFLELLTFGIIPQDLWYEVTPNMAGLAELNLKPIGSGPYKFKSLTKDKKGQVKSYSLVVNEDYYNSRAYIENLTFKLFPNFEEAIDSLNKGLIDGISYLPKIFEKDLVAQDSLYLHKLNLPQLTAIFFNKKNNEILADKSIRQALALAINKPEIIENVLTGDARLIDGPILPDSFAYNPDNTKYAYNKEAAIKLLEEAGWKTFEITDEDITRAEGDKENEDEKIKQEAERLLSIGSGKWRRKDDKFLVVRLSTVDIDENRQVVEALKGFWEEIGVKADLELVPTNKIETDTIKPRNFEALFYGQIVGADPDLYVFWHSSQIGEEGLNLSNYSNKEVDQLLEDARITSNIEDRKTKYKKFQEIITGDLSTIFLYSPTYTYVQSKKVKGFDTKTILTPRDRFANIASWYVKTGKKLIWE